MPIFFSFIVLTRINCSNSGNSCSILAECASTPWPMPLMKSETLKAPSLAWGVEQRKREGMSRGRGRGHSLATTISVDSLVKKQSKTERNHHSQTSHPKHSQEVSMRRCSMRGGPLG
eukprot:c20828_g1_i1 orf=75-425(-)